MKGWQVSIKGWQDFLDSLSTKGGNLFLLFVGLGIAMTFIVHTVHHGADDKLLQLGHDLVVGFAAALWAGLSGASSRQQMADRVQTAIMGAPPVPPPGGSASTVTATTVTDQPSSEAK